MQSENGVYVPEVDSNFSKWGNYYTIKQVIESGKFYPVWVTGETGVGKTVNIEQACAELKRKFIRINFTAETDEHDLIGGFRMVNGDTVFHEGPVISALREGAILLLDEIDAGNTNKIMLLQSLLEGKGIFMKQKGEWVKPAKGFNVFATSNTKGFGDETGKYLGTNIMNGAFLDRFCGMIHQDYPPKDEEEKILKNYFVSYVLVDKYDDEDSIPDEVMENGNMLVAKLCEWARYVREQYKVGGLDDNISTRTLVNVIQAQGIFEDEMLALKMACERYPDATKEAFLSFWSKISPEGEIPDEKEQEEEKYKHFKKL